MPHQGSGTVTATAAEAYSPSRLKILAQLLLVILPPHLRQNFPLDLDQLGQSMIDEKHPD
jgi:hypothetical protein